MRSDRLYIQAFFLPERLLHWLRLLLRWGWRLAALLLVLLSLLITLFLSISHAKKSPKIPQHASDSLHQTVALAKRQVRLQIIGDMGKQGLAQDLVSTAMEKRCQQQKPDALIFLGDNIYVAGVTSVDDPKWHNDLLQYYQSPCLQDVPIYALLGNHDYRGNAQAQIDYNSKDPRWNMPFRYYQVQFGDLLSITMLDTWFPNICLFSSDGNCMLNFTWNTLSNNNTLPWRLVAGHHPIRSASLASSKHAGGVNGRILESILCQLAPDAYLAGHSHHLEHSISPVCDMDIIVSGAGGGRNLYPVKTELKSNEKFARSIHGFVELFATPHRMEYLFFDTNNRWLYTTTRKQKPTFKLAKL